MASSAPTPLRQLIENRLSQLAVETETLFADTRERVRRETADQLNQAVRRLRQASTSEELCATLVDAAGPFASRVLLLRVDQESAVAQNVKVLLKDAPALRGAIETRDPVIAAASSSELSPGLMELLEQPADGRVFIFPVVVKEAVPVLLCASGEVQGSSVELLTQVAAAAWKPAAAPAGSPDSPKESESAPKEKDLIQLIGRARPETKAVSKASASWDTLPPEEQQWHLRAQRFARVQVAEMRLFSPETVQAGREKHDLYNALRQPIDKAREDFRSQFFAGCPSMVDYLHLELIRTLANEDSELLGKNYPGPMV